MSLEEEGNRRSASVSASASVSSSDDIVVRDLNGEFEVGEVLDGGFGVGGMGVGMEEGEEDGGGGRDEESEFVLIF